MASASPATAAAMGGEAAEAGTTPAVPAADSAGAAEAEVDAELRRHADDELRWRMGGRHSRSELAEAAADLRALIKVKVADDQDLKTAQQAVAEAAHFFVALQQEAAGLGVSADEQLQHYVQ